MSKLVTRQCPACGESKSFRSDQLTCGCKVSRSEEGSRVTYLRRENLRLKSQLESLKDVEGYREELTSAVVDAVSALEPLPPVAYKNGHPSASPIYPVLKLSDWHIGATINPRETEGFGTFDWKVAQARAAYIAEKFLGSVEIHRKSFSMPVLHIFGEGDWVSGNIHDELKATNEFPLPVQAVKAGELLAQTVATLAPHFEKVVLVEEGADNHGRLQPKPQAKQKASNNMSFVTYSVANALLREHKNIETIFPEAMKVLVNVGGVYFLLEHGDNVKAWMGIPYYGLERSRAREASRRMASMLAKKRKDEFYKYQKQTGFDFISTAHWHVPGIVSENILINGSLTGTDEYDHSAGRHARPSQVSFLVHPRHGMFSWTAWKPER